MTTPTVHVALPPGDDGPADTVRDEVTRALADLTGDLALPMRDVAVTTAGGDRLAVTINGVPCEVAAGFSARRFGGAADRIVDAVHTHARLLVTAETAEAVWSAVHGPAGSPVPLWFPGLVRDLVHHRVRPQRLRSVAGLHTGADAEALFEAAVTAAGRPCRITVDETTASTMKENPAELRELMAFLATGLSAELGMPIAVPHLEVDPALPEYHFAAQVNDVRVPPRPGIRPDEILVNDTAERLAWSGLAVTAVTNPATGQPAALAPASVTAELESRNLTTWTMSGYIVLSVAEIIRRSAAALYRLDILQYQVDRFAADHPALAPMVEALGGTRLVIRVLRRLVDEGVPVHNLPAIVSALYEAAAPAPVVPGLMSFATRPHRVRVVDTAEIGNVREASLAETARVAVSAAIGNKLSRGSATLVVYLLDPQVENRLRDPAGITAAERRALLDMVAEELSYLPATAQIPVFLTRSDLRARFRSVIAVEYPNLVVVAYEELHGGWNIQPIARLSLPG